QIAVGFLGPEGTFSEEAARKSFINYPDASFQPYSTILDVMEAARAGEVVFGVVPAENTVGGSIYETIDWLAHEGVLAIVAQFVLPISQNLVGLEGATLDQIKHISSHPQGLAQCRSFLRQLTGISIETAESTSTAAAAQRVAVKADLSYAAIGSAWAAQKYGLKILQPDIQDVAGNSTSFFIVARPDVQTVTDYKEPHPSQTFKTSLIITLSTDKPGALVYILNVFAAGGINLTRIESRPTRKLLGSYWFFVDIEGHQEDEHVDRALQAIRIFGHEVRVLGSYTN
ncbi:MAG: prephenate dehydratase, partial [Bacilli bacterium]|nr:prephenate dehydratase [Bacilli bacterium]